MKKIVNMVMMIVLMSANVLMPMTSYGNDIPLAQSCNEGEVWDESLSKCISNQMGNSGEAYDIEKGDGESNQNGMENKDIEGEGKDIEGEGKDIEGEGKDIEGEGKDIEGEDKSVEGEGKTVEGEDNSSVLEIESEVPIVVLSAMPSAAPTEASEGLKVATLLPGKEFNTTIKKLYDSWGSYTSYNSSIQKILESADPAPEGKTVGYLTAEGSEVKISVWHENNTVFYYVEKDDPSDEVKIMMNEDSSYMFYYMYGLQEIDLSNWDTSNVTDMSYMFYYNESLTSLDLSNWDTSNVTDMSYMFYDNRSLTSLDLSNWDTSNVTDMSYMVAGLRVELDFSKLNTSNVMSMKGMFSNSSVKNLDLSKLDTSNVTDMSYMFANLGVELDFSKLNTSNVTDMSYMFANLRVELDFSKLNTSNVTSMKGMFSHLAARVDLSKLDTSNVTDMSYMFANLGVELDFSKLNTSNVIDMSHMFQGTTLTNIDLSNWDTSNVEDMTFMFYMSKNLKEVNLSNWDTSRVKNIKEFFEGCTNLESIKGIEYFNTENVTDISFFFKDCVKLKEVDLSSWDTKNVTRMKHVFVRNKTTSGIYGLETIYVSDKFVVNDSVDDGGGQMFGRAVNLVGGNGTTWKGGDWNGKEYARIDGGAENPGYFTTKVPRGKIIFVDADVESIEQEAGTLVNKPSDPIRTGYKFLGRSRDIPDTMQAGTISIKAMWSDEYSITFNTDGGNEIDVITLPYGSKITPPTNPEKKGYRFVGWEPSIPEVMPAEDVVVIAQWEKKGSKRSGGGGRSSDAGGEHGSADEKDSRETESPQNDKESELFDMHQRAYENGLTIYAPGEDAKFDQPLTRQQMAKISSIFGYKFLNQKADDSEGKVYECSQYKDLSKSKGEMRWYVVQSCLLGNMGYAYDGVNLIKKFRPYDKLTVAQASVILSRMAWGDKYVISPKKWYQGHMYAAYDHGLIDDISNPQREITRGEAFMMMYRLSLLMK